MLLFGLSSGILFFLLIPVTTRRPKRRRRDIVVVSVTENYPSSVRSDIIPAYAAPTGLGEQLRFACYKDFTPDGVSDRSFILLILSKSQFETGPSERARASQRG